MLGFIKKAFFRAMACQELMKQDIEWDKTCKCKCRVDASVCNIKQNADVSVKN